MNSTSNPVYTDQLLSLHPSRHGSIYGIQDVGAGQTYWYDWDMTLQPIRLLQQGPNSPTVP